MEKYYARMIKRPSSYALKNRTDYFYNVLNFFILDEAVFRSRHLLSSVEWEKCDFEVGNKRNYSDPGSWRTVNSAYGWVCLYVFGILVIFIGMCNYKNIKNIDPMFL